MGMSGDKDPAEIDIDLGRQRLKLLEAGGSVFEAPVSTAARGAGEVMDSERTPRGWHVICEKIGAGVPMNTVFVGRRPTGELYTPELREQFPERDWILTRILWLKGTEPGRNLGGTVDSRSRYIYIHGCPQDVALSAPGSRGCIRMRNELVMELFNRVQVGTRVFIHE